MEGLSAFTRKISLIIDLCLAKTYRSRYLRILSRIGSTSNEEGYERQNGREHNNGGLHLSTGGIVTPNSDINKQQEQRREEGAPCVHTCASGTEHKIAAPDSFCRRCLGEYVGAGSSRHVVYISALLRGLLTARMRTRLNSRMFKIRYSGGRFGSA